MAAFSAGFISFLCKWVALVKRSFHADDRPQCLRNFISNLITSCICCSAIKFPKVKGRTLGIRIIQAPRRYLASSSCRKRSTEHSLPNQFLFTTTNYRHYGTATETSRPPPANSTCSSVSPCLNIFLLYSVYFPHNDHTYLTCMIE